MAYTILVSCIVLFLLITLMFLRQVRGLEARGGGLSPIDPEKKSKILGFFIGCGLFKAFYALTGLHFAILTSASFGRQAADFLCLTAFMALGVQVFDAFTARFRRETTAP